MVRLLIAFIGMDGTGKTTLSGKVVTQLNNMGLSSQCVKCMEYVIIKLVKRPEALGKIGETSNRSKVSSKFVFRIWPYLVMFDNIIHFLVRVKPVLSQKRIVVCDRYYYDFIASFEYFRLCALVAKKIYFKIVPRPDIVFVLDVDAEIAFKRSREYHIGFFKEQRMRYRNMAYRHNFVVVNTKQRQAVTLKHVLYEITRVNHKITHTRRSGT